MQRNARDERQVERAKEAERQAAKKRKEDLMFVMGDPKGRRVVWDQLAFAGVFNLGWDPSAKIHFNAGMRNVGLRLFQELHQVCPDLYLLMAKEAEEADKKRQELDDLMNEAENGGASG